MTDKETVVALYRQENQAMVDKDIVTLNRILALKMTLRHMTGYVQPKMEWIDQIQNGEMTSTEDAIKDVQIDGNQASLTGQNQVKASVWGSSVSTWPLQMKMKFVKRNGRWIIMSQEASTYGENGNLKYNPVLRPYRKAADVIEGSDLNYTVVRPGWFTAGPVDYEVTHKGEPFGGHDVSVSSIADLVKKLVDDDQLYSHDSVGINTPQ